MSPSTLICWRCDGSQWVCERHPERPRSGDHACGCGAAGMPCPICNPSDEQSPPKMPPGFKVDTDKNGSRH